jgi:hypothetical protein
MSGTSRESVVREAFKPLLKDLRNSRDLTVTPIQHQNAPLVELRTRSDRVHVLYLF